MIDRKKVTKHLRQGKHIRLREAEGCVYTIPEFFRRFGHVLSRHEQTVVAARLGLFRKPLPPALSSPLAAEDSAIATGGFAVKATSIGSRSAFIESKKIKLKGCRPKPDLNFPHERLDFGSRRMKEEKIQFGALTAENAIREILGYCFFKAKGLPILQRPLCIFEYRNRGKAAGYCVAYSTPTDTRLESREDYEDMKVSDMIKFGSGMTGIGKVPDEFGFRGISREWYSREKAKLLIRMNFGGGFRGVLNSNIGNDIIHRGRLYICDFDTFHVIAVPRKPSKRFLDGFALWCLVELLKTSPLVSGYVDADGMNHQEVAEKLWAIYNQRSSLWKSYRGMFSAKARSLDWSAEAVKASMEKARKSSTFFDIIIDNVLNSYVLKNTYRPELSFYNPH